MTLIEDLYDKSPHQPVFAGMGLGGCVVCHGNHAVLRPSDALLAGPNAVCSQCHEESSAGAVAAAEMSRSIASLQTALKRSDDSLGTARRSGMEVSEGHVAPAGGTRNPDQG
jgi:predicted CXXCH cytochrome family protein